MILPSPEFIPDAALERRALRLLREHEEICGEQIRLPVPVDLIVQRTLKLNVTWVEIEEPAGEIILARLTPDYLGKPTIQMNQRRLAHFDEYFGTEAYSLAHEGGHWIFHYNRGGSTQPPIPGLLDPSDDTPFLCRRLTAADRREIQAERFAAYLLMPDHLVTPLLSGWDLTRWTAIAELSRTCGVSKRAFVRRLEQLGRIQRTPGDQLVSPEPAQDGPLLV